MTFLDLQNQVAYWLDDLNFGYFTTTQVQRWVNNAQQEVQKRLIQAGQNWYLANPVQTSTVANQECYSLPSDFLKVEHLECITSGTFPSEQKNILTHSTHRESDMLIFQTSTPQTFFLQKNCLILRPVPDNVYTLRLHYTYRVSDMVNSTDVPDCPAEYQEFIAVLAAIDGKIKDGRDMSSLLEKKAFYEELLEESSQNRMVDKPREVVITSDDGYGVLF